MAPVFVAWAISAVVLVVAAVKLGRAVGQGPSGILIDTRGRYSLTQFQLAGWTVVVLSLVSGVAFGRLFGGAASDALGFAIPDELLIVMGISLGSAVGAYTVKASKDAAYPRRIAASDGGDPPRFAQMFLVEEGEFADQVIDITKFQNFWLTLVLLVVYVAVAVGKVAAAGSPGALTSLPQFSPTFVVLLGISHAGYLAGKLPTRPGPPKGLTLGLKREGAVPVARPAVTGTPPTYVPRNPAAA